MNFEELWNNAKNSKWIYLVILVVFLLIVFIAIRTNRKNKLQKRIDEGQVRINDLKSHPFAVDIAKTDAIARVNVSIKDTANQCKKDFDVIQNNIKSIVSNLQDANEYILASKFKLCEQKLDENDKLISETDKLTNKLQGVLANVLNQSQIQRKRITELKNQFHEIKSQINENPNNYTYCWESLDRITNSISHQFSDFEAIMDASKYEEATQTAQDISVSIDSLNDLVTRLPELINKARAELPEKLNSLKNAYTVMSSQGAYLEHLNIPGSTELIKNSLNSILNKIKMCDISEVSASLYDCESKIDQLASNLEDEKNAYKDLLKSQSLCRESLKTTGEIIEKVRNNDLAGFDRYRLTDLNKSYERLGKELDVNQKAFDSLVEAFNSRSIPPTTLIVTFKEIENDISESLKQAKNISGSLSSTKTNELRIKELLSRFVVVLNESKASIALSKLPNISAKYQSDITQAEKYIEEINEKLQQETVDMNELNTTINDSQKLIVSLYKNVNSIVSTAREIEEFIISCNKYRPYYPDVDAALYSAELVYRNGEYTKACRKAISALETIDPQIAQQLSKSIDEKLIMQKEA